LSPNEKEYNLLQELSEVFCFSLLPLNEFNCLPLRCLLREILSNHLLKTTVNNLTDPDYINQTILYLCQDQLVPKTENFLVTLSYSDSLDELRELRNRIEDEILKTRSNDKGMMNRRPNSWHLTC
jgi:sorting nexin-13